jgi:hypothetical protein
VRSISSDKLCFVAAVNFTVKSSVLLLQTPSAMHVIESGPRYLSVIFSGAVDQAQLFKALMEIFRHPEYPDKNSMWIFEGCECDFSNISMFDMLQMVRAYYPKETTRTKTAVVTSTSMHHAMAQLFCQEADQIPLSFTLRAFMNRSEAVEWLGADLKPEDG